MLVGLGVGLAAVVVAGLGEVLPEDRLAIIFYILFFYFKFLNFFLISFDFLVGVVDLGVGLVAA